MCDGPAACVKTQRARSWGVGGGGHWGALAGRSGGAQALARAETTVTVAAASPGGPGSHGGPAQPGSGPATWPHKYDTGYMTQQGSGYLVFHPGPPPLLLLVQLLVKHKIKGWGWGAHESPLVAGFGAAQGALEGTHPTCTHSLCPLWPTTTGGRGEGGAHTIFKAEASCALRFQLGKI